MRSLTMRIFLTFFFMISVITIGMLYVTNNRVVTDFDSYVMRNHMMGMNPMGENHHGDSIRGGMNREDENGVVVRRLPPFPTRGDNEILFLMDLRSSLFKMAGLMLIVSGAVSYFLAKSIGAPIRELSVATKRVAGGDFSTPVTVARKDEVGQLAISFNEMTHRLSTIAALRERYLATIAHELRTPLTILKANLEGMQDGIVEPGEKQIDSLIEEVDRLTRIVSSLKEITLKEEELGIPEYSKVDITGMLRQIVDKSVPLATEKGIELSLEDKIPTFIIDGDEFMLQHVFYNLIMNAIKYTPQGTIAVSIKREGTDICVSIADTGIGISEADKEHIFDPFFRVDPSGNKKTGGSGLGLAIVKYIVSVMKGSVHVESTLNVGSTFIVRLPEKRIY